MSIPQTERCANCQLYDHVHEVDRAGRQWRYATGYCNFKPPSSKRPIPRKTDFESWCENWKGTHNMDVSRAIIEEGNRRYNKKLENGEIKQPKKVVSEATFVDRSYRPLEEPIPQEGETEPGPEEKASPLTESWLHVRAAAMEAQSYGHAYATCSTEALLDLVAALEGKMELPADGQ